MKSKPALKGYRLLRFGKDVVQSGDMVCSPEGVFRKWKPAFGLIGKSVHKLRTGFHSKWIACRKIPSAVKGGSR